MRKAGVKYSLSLLLGAILFMSGCGSGGGNSTTVTPTTVTIVGALDTDFADTGYVSNDGGNGADYGQSIAVDSSGNIFVTGYSHNGSDFDMAVWKYTSTGNLDTGFGTGGIVTHDNAAGGSFTDIGNSITLDSSGNIYIAGYSSNGSDNDMAIWKYDSSGSLDTGFGTGGIVIHNSAAGGNDADSGNSITLDSSGNIYVTGYSDNGSNDDMVIWKYDSSGSLDTDFGTGGIVTHNDAAGGDDDDYGNSIALDSSGNIYVAGYSDNGSNDDMVIWKYTVSGSLDTGFNSTGYLTNNNAAGGSGDDHGHSIALDSSGDIYVTGRSYNGTNYDMAIWKYDSSGSLDTGFNSTGYLTHDNAAGGSGYDSGNSITFDSSGYIYVAGYSENSSDVDMAVWKIK